MDALPKRRSPEKRGSLHRPVQSSLTLPNSRREAVASARVRWPRPVPAPICLDLTIAIFRTRWLASFCTPCHGHGRGFLL